MNTIYEECHNSAAPTRMESLLKVSGVSKSFTTKSGMWPFQKTKTVEVLKDFTLDIQDIHGHPQIVALLGQSGSGKTTALRIIAGLDQADSGEVLISNGGRGDEHAMTSIQAGQVGVVFQKYTLFNNLNVFNNLVQPGVKTGTPYQEAAERATAFLNAFGMQDSMTSYPAELSGGMRQRVAILQQLMVENRRFIVLDEPFSGLDVKNLQLVTELLNSVANMHTLNTFIIVTHDVTNALIVADTIYVLGREHINDKPIGPARVMKTYDLIGEGLAYHKNIEDIPKFAELRKELKYNVIPHM